MHRPPEKPAAESAAHGHALLPQKCRAIATCPTNSGNALPRDRPPVTTPSHRGRPPAALCRPLALRPHRDGASRAWRSVAAGPAARGKAVSRRLPLLSVSSWARAALSKPCRRSCRLWPSLASNARIVVNYRARRGPGGRWPATLRYGPGRPQKTLRLARRALMVAKPVARARRLVAKRRPRWPGNPSKIRIERGGVRIPCLIVQKSRT